MIIITRKYWYIFELIALCNIPEYKITTSCLMSCTNLNLNMFILKHIANELNNSGICTHEYGQIKLFDIYTHTLVICFGKRPKNKIVVDFIKTLLRFSLYVLRFYKDSISGGLISERKFIRK